MKAMKKIEEYIDENYNLNKDEDGNEVFFKWEVRDIIKQVLVDTIEYTVKRCAEEAKIEYIPEDGCATGDYYDINKQSILNVADKIKEEVNYGR